MPYVSMTAGDGSVEHSEARALKSDDTVFLVIRNECSEPVTLTVEHEIDIVLTLPIRPLRNIVQVRESRLMWVSVAFAFRTTAQAQHLGVIIMLLSVIGYVECVAVRSKQCLELCALACHARLRTRFCGVQGFFGFALGVLLLGIGKWLWTYVRAGREAGEADKLPVVIVCSDASLACSDERQDTQDMEAQIAIEPRSGVAAPLL